ncbi:MAG: DeoR/GlpR transcriptional regulator [Clostridia bacterium]|nr:DeoR/GlpR transcriptional regulator [Clostridia bacterium]
MKSRRLTEMEGYILTHGSAAMEELRDAFGISMNTVRRDIAELVQGGRVEKVYGGVKAIEQVQPLVPYAVRCSSPSRAKQAICAAAGEMVRDGDIIFIDSGTTTPHIMDVIKDRKITVITNNIEVMFRALDHENIRLIVVPGEIHRKTHSITGEDSAAFLSHMNTTLAFMAATGASMTNVTNSSPLEYSIKKAAVAHTEKAVLLVTGNKFGVTSLLTYASLDQFHAVITDSTIPLAYRERLEEMRVSLKIVETGE